MASREIAGTTIDVRLGDITHEAVDAIVNAANRSLLGGGGVDGAIHAAGGPAILEECRRLGGCPTGEARITGAGRLPARYVIHTVGPVFRDGGPEDAGLLAAAYRSSLMLAREHGLRRVAFPSISTGAYGYPIAAAAPIALGTVSAVCREHPGTLDLVRFVLFGARDMAVYEGALAGL
jgi:O-acetyl-ADP-ribose deacetylase (regulator of RNase III)